MVGLIEAPYRWQGFRLWSPIRGNDCASFDLAVLAWLVASIGMRKAGIGQRASKRHEDDQSDGRDNNYHDDHFRVVETLARDQQCSGNIALSYTESHDSSRIG